MGKKIKKAIWMKRKTVIPYNQKLKELARHLRKSSTLSEVLLWRYLKRKQMMGYDFDRQKPIDNYIVDFFCNELMLAIEIDGSTHNCKSEEDRKRQTKLEALGVRFLRFNDLDIKKNLDGVLGVIGNWIREHTNKSAPYIPCLSQEKAPTPCPSQEGNSKTRDSIHKPPGSSCKLDESAQGSKSEIWNQQSAIAISSSPVGAGLQPEPAKEKSPLGRGFRGG